MTPTQKDDWKGLLIALVAIVTLFAGVALVVAIQRQNDIETSRDCYIRTETGGQC